MNKIPSDKNIIPVDTGKLIEKLIYKIGNLELQNAALEAQLESNEDGDENGKQDTKS